VRSIVVSKKDDNDDDDDQCFKRKNPNRVILTKKVKIFRNKRSIKAFWLFISELCYHKGKNTNEGRLAESKKQCTLKLWHNVAEKLYTKLQSDIRDEIKQNGYSEYVMGSQLLKVFELAKHFDEYGVNVCNF